MFESPFSLLLLFLHPRLSTPSHSEFYRSNVNYAAPARLWAHPSSAALLGSTLQRYIKPTACDRRYPVTPYCISVSSGLLVFHLLSAVAFSQCCLQLGCRRSSRLLQSFLTRLFFFRGTGPSPEPDQPPPLPLTLCDMEPVFRLVVLHHLRSMQYSCSPAKLRFGPPYCHIQDPLHELWAYLWFTESAGAELKLPMLH